MSLRRWIITAVALLLLGTGLWWWLAPTTFVTGVIAACATEAVVLSRQNTDRSTSFWVSLQTTDGPAWVHRAVDADDVSAESLTTSDARVTYLMLQEQQLVVVGLDRQTGAVAWETLLGEIEDHYLTTWLYAISRVEGDMLLVPHYAGEGMLAALALSDGTLRWRQPLPETSELPTGLWLQHGDTHHFETIDPSDGTRTVRGDAAFNQCLLEDMIYTVREDALVRVFPADDAAPISLPVEGGRLKACGRQGEAMILTLTVGDKTVLARVDEGEITGILSLDWPHATGGPSCRIARFSQASHALKAELPRFLPLMFSAMDPDIDTLRFIVVDLADLTIAAEATPSREYLYFEQLRAGDTHYFWYHGGLTIAVDGATGSLTGTSRGGRSLDGRSIVDGVVWMGGEGVEGWQPPRRPAAAWLDGRTLEALGTVGKTSAFQPADDAIMELTGWTIP
jgi:hypothetical protein